VGVNGVLRDWHPIKAGDVFDPPAATSRIAYWKRKVHGLIRARQAADADGIPYELFIRTALRHFYFGGGTYVMQREDQAGKRTMMPEPNLLYGEECLAQIREAWLEQVQMRVHGARHPRYLAANDDGHPDHGAHRDWLASQIAHRAVQDRVTARLVREGWLTVRQAVRMVRDPQLLARTLRASP
jgi:hypothetical protein